MTEICLMMDRIPYHHYQYHVMHYPYRWSVMPGTTIALRNKPLPHSCFANDVWLQSLSLHLCQKPQGVLASGSLLACSDHRVVSYYVRLPSMAPYLCQKQQCMLPSRCHAQRRKKRECPTEAQTHLTHLTYGSMGGATNGNPP